MEGIEVRSQRRSRSYHHLWNQEKQHFQWFTYLIRKNEARYTWRTFSMYCEGRKAQGAGTELWDDVERDPLFCSLEQTTEVNSVKSSYAKFC